MPSGEETTISEVEEDVQPVQKQIEQQTDVHVEQQQEIKSLELKPEEVSPPKNNEEN
jgi:hypothetical protein